MDLYCSPDQIAKLMTSAMTNSSSAMANSRKRLTITHTLNIELVDSAESSGTAFMQKSAAFNSPSFEKSLMIKKPIRYSPSNDFHSNGAIDSFSANIFSVMPFFFFF